MEPAWTLELHCTSTCAFTDSNYLADQAGVCVCVSEEDGRGCWCKRVQISGRLHAAVCPSERRVALVCSCHLLRKEPTQLIPMTETVNLKREKSGARAMLMLIPLFFSFGDCAVVKPGNVLRCRRNTVANVEQQKLIFRKLKHNCCLLSATSAKGNASKRFLLPFCHPHLQPSGAGIVAMC